jgi:hypothetical protein
MQVSGGATGGGLQDWLGTHLYAVDDILICFEHPHHVAGRLYAGHSEVCNPILGYFLSLHAVRRQTEPEIEPSPDPGPETNSDCNSNGVLHTEDLTQPTIATNNGF